MGGYVKRSLGIKVFFKPENPKGTRIQSISVKGRNLNSDSTYKAVFITEQGVPAKYGSGRAKTDLHAVEAMKKYLMKKKTVNTGLYGTFIPV